MRFVVFGLLAAVLAASCSSVPDGDKINNGKWVAMTAPFDGCATVNGRKFCVSDPANPSAKFCIGSRAQNTDYFVYSEVYAEAKAYEFVNGQCDPNTLKTIDTLVLGYKWNSDDPRPGVGTRAKVCSNSSICTYSERFYGITRTITCTGVRGENKGWKGGAYSDGCGVP